MVRHTGDNWATSALNSLLTMQRRIRPSVPMYTSDSEISSNFFLGLIAPSF